MKIRARSMARSMEVEGANYQEMKNHPSRPKEEITPMFDGYFVEGGDILENKLGITDAKELQDIEYRLSAEKTSEILQADLAGFAGNLDPLELLYATIVTKIA